MFQLGSKNWFLSFRLLALALLLSTGSLFFLGSAAGQSGQHRRFNLMGEAVGVVGYDPVSYFPEGGEGPQKGLIGINAVLDGVTYRFASEANKNAFLANAAKYQPIYGGWCAWAVGAIAKRVDVDPENYLVREGKLYLFYRDPQLDTRALWLKDEESLARKADANWPSLSQ